MTKLNLLLLFGGRSGEHAVSLMSAGSIIAAIDAEKYSVHQVGITQDGVWLTGEHTLQVFKNDSTNNLHEAILVNESGSVNLYTRIENLLSLVTPIDIIFPVLHGTFGEDGTIQGLFEILDVAYVGAGVLASSVSMDKSTTKHIIESEGIPVLAYDTYSRREINTDIQAVMNRCEAIAPYPLFVKPANLGSSVGITKAHNRAELEIGLNIARRYDRRVIVEKGISAREIEISVIGNDQPIHSVPGEVIPDAEFYTYQDKYYNGEAELCIPAPLTDQQTSLVQNYAIQAFKSLDCSGLARVDFLMDKLTDDIYFSEINTMPGFTDISMFPKLWKVCGLSYPELVDRLIDLAFERKAERDETVRRFEG
ncbi:MAG: D-alanine--D-alanine ligase family protein [Anaerolineaceae bacterium]